MALTDRDMKVLKVVRKFIERRGYPPTMREIARILGLKSTSGVHTSLRRLQQEGLVKWEPGRPGTLREVSSAR
jgi:repressor LexA